MDEIRPQFYTIQKKLTLNGLRADTVKLLEGNTGYKFHSVGPGNDFLDRKPKKKKNSQATQKNHTELHKTKRLLHRKKKTQQVKKAT